jgi:hypothetical protein
MMTFTLFLNEQGEILKALLELYYPRGAKVIDLTYGTGKLWSAIRENPALKRHYRVTACDAAPILKGVRKKNLLTDDYASLGRHDAAVFDPPYLIGRKSFDYRKPSSRSWAKTGGLKRYTSNQTLEEFNRRVECLAEKTSTFLKPGGLLIVKVLDPRKDGTLITHHINIANLLSARFKLIDLAGYIRMGATTWKIRGHLQNLHGYWMIFKLKPNPYPQNKTRKRIWQGRNGNEMRAEG